MYIDFNITAFYYSMIDGSVLNILVMVYVEATKSNHDDMSKWNNGEQKFARTIKLAVSASFNLISFRFEQDMNSNQYNNFKFYKIKLNKEKKQETCWIHDYSERWVIADQG